jgi:hypothetical protein
LIEGRPELHGDQGIRGSEGSTPEWFKRVTYIGVSIVPSFFAGWLGNKDSLPLEVIMGQSFLTCASSFILNAAGSASSS